jgi:hypothetical protein
MFKFRLLLGPDRMYIICCWIRTLKKNTKLLTLYNNKPQHQETNTIQKMEQTELTGTLNYRLYTITKLSTKNQT